MVGIVPLLVIVSSLRGVDSVIVTLHQRRGA
jgi:hypothetical protein